MLDANVFEIKFDSKVSEASSVIHQDFNLAREWSQWLIVDSKIAALITTVWFTGDVVENRLRHVSHMDGCDLICYATERISNNSANRLAKSHSIRISEAVKDNIPIFGILKLKSRTDPNNERIASNIFFELNYIDKNTLPSFSQELYIFSLIPRFSSIGAILNILAYDDAQTNPLFNKYSEQRQSQSRYIEAANYVHVHSLILNKLIERLKQSNKRVKAEYSMDGERIDAVTLNPNKTIQTVYEVKTEKTMRLNIRAALGQILSYGLLISGTAKSLIVVSNAVKDDEGISYLRDICKLLGPGVTLDYIFIDISA